MKKKAIRVLCLVLAVALLAPGAFAVSAIDFTDVDGHWAYDSIAYIVDNGLFTGTSDTMFEPDAPMTRAMFVTVLGRYYETIFGALANNNDSYNDTQSGQWYSKYVYWATEAKIINGYGNNMFGPGDAVTREQGILIIYRFAEHLYFQLDDGADTLLTGFEDSSDISSWAKDAILWSLAEGIMNGVSSDRLAPGQDMTRAQTAVLLHRFMTTYAITSSQRTVSVGDATTIEYDLSGYKGWQLIISNTGNYDVSVLMGIDDTDVMFRHNSTVKAGEALTFANAIEADQNQLFVSVTRAGVTVEVEIVELFSDKPFLPVLDSVIGIR